MQNPTEKPLKLNRYMYQKMSIVVVKLLHSVFFCLHTVCMSVSVCTCNDHCFVYALLQVLTRLLLRMSNCLLKSTSYCPQHFYIIMYIGVTDNGVCRIIPLHVHRTYCIYTVLYDMQQNLQFQKYI